MKAIRGATTVLRDTPEQIKDAVKGTTEGLR